VRSWTIFFLSPIQIRIANGSERCFDSRNGADAIVARGTINQWKLETYIYSYKNANGISIH